MSSSFICLHLHILFIPLQIWYLPNLEFFCIPDISQSNITLLSAENIWYIQLSSISFKHIENLTVCIFIFLFMTAFACDFIISFPAHSLFMCVHTCFGIIDILIAQLYAIFHQRKSNCESSGHQEKTAGMRSWPFVST